MDRVIKFRVWDKEQDCWLDEDFIGPLLIQLMNGNIYVSNRYKFEQFTGFVDKDGTEIYEGDIIETIPYLQQGDETIKGKVFMSDQGRWTVEEIHPHYSETEWLCECVNSPRSKIIGNIHQPLSNQGK